ncbi:MAG: lysine 2,3-aminomutase [Planctomycetes bacterium]|nr:lysine 2,3-aminomutase [Planctomycetota bacterium]NOG53821.1 lysine 2,3-aminomutase [Planctomycetota bacterium]
MLQKETIHGSPRFQPVTRRNVKKTPQWGRLTSRQRRALRVVSAVLPFKTNRYIMDELIDWDRLQDDPMFQLTFPQRDMLAPDDFHLIACLLDSGAESSVIKSAVQRIRIALNPQPAGQLSHNQPTLDGRPLAGLQHKYEQTVLYFPSQGQTCHAYCTFCFRWAQFVREPELKLESRQVQDLVSYLKAHREVTDVLITGGDPMIMSTAALRRHIEPLLDPELEHLRSIRIGTKSVAYWPHRFVSDRDADECLELFEQIVGTGKHLAIMGHYNHPVELSTPVSREAVRRIRDTGAQVRMQSPVVRHVNDDPVVWADLWQRGVELGCVPYYMFVERDTGAQRYFEIPLTRAWHIFRKAYQQVSGLARTVRGPSMSAFPGKIRILGTRVIDGQEAFILDYLQARRPELVRIPFFARYDPDATWFDQLKPLRSEDAAFFDHETTSTNRPPTIQVRVHDRPEHRRPQPFTQTPRN